MAKKKKRIKYVTLKAPDEAWTFLIEHLEMDARSSSFDPELRREIRLALDSVHATEMKEIGKRWPREVRWTLKLPEWAWETIGETLVMDGQSKWIDDDIKEKIGEALEQVEQVW